MSHKPKTVLIVDDDEGMRDTLTAILKREHRVLRVASGEAALPVLNREDVDLVLLDVRLPGISGFEVLRIVKENYTAWSKSSRSRPLTDRNGRPGDEARRVSLHHQGLRLRPVVSLVRNARASARISNRQVPTLSAASPTRPMRVHRRAERMTRDIVTWCTRSPLSATVLIPRRRAAPAAAWRGWCTAKPATRTPPLLPSTWLRCAKLAESTLSRHERGAHSPARMPAVGRVRAASNGTLFLDEIGDLRMDLQAKLLRAIQEEDRTGGRHQTHQDRVPPHRRDKRRSG